MKSRSNFVEPISETGNWNTAQSFIQFKVAKLLVELDEYQEISQYGTANIVEEFVVGEPEKDIAKIKGIFRFHSTLMMLIENTFFAVKKHNDKELMKKYYRDLKRLKPLVQEVKLRKMINGRMRDSIDEEVFNWILDVLVDIKSKVNIPLNNSDLIFNSVEDFDPDKFKMDIKKRMSERP